MLVSWTLLLFVASPFSVPQQEREEIVASRLFAATSSGSYESYDWGEAWHPMAERLPGRVRTFLCLGPDAFAGGVDGLYGSKDHGARWSPITSWQGGAVSSLLSSSFFPVEPVLFAGTEEGLYRSRDAGERWERVGEDVIRGSVHDIAWPGPDLFVATSHGLYRSGDGGEAWSEVGQGLPGVPLLCLEVSRFFGRDPVMFVGTEGEGLYRSGDGGATFQLLESPGRTFYCLFWWRASLLAGTEAGALVSGDAGETWESLAEEVEGLSVYAIHIPAPSSPSGSDILLGTERGIFKSSNGGLEWRHLTNGLGPVAVEGLGNFPIPTNAAEPEKK